MSADRAASPWALVGESAGVAVVSYVIAGLVETGLIRVLQPSERALAWVSDLVLALALGTTFYLWRHLSRTRQALAARERAEIVFKTEMTVAADIQHRLLPDIPEASDGLEWAAALEPAGMIGGDFYDVVPLAPGSWMLLVADVSGKGVPAAMALALVRAAFRSLSAPPASPGHVLTGLSAALRDQWAGALYLTAIVARIDVAAGTITYANAGHPAGLVIGAGGERRLEPNGPPAALLAGIAYLDREVAFEPGDVCVLVSDGVTEALGDGWSADLTRLARGGRSVCRAGLLCQAVMQVAALGDGPSGIRGWQDDRTVVVLSRRDEAASSRFVA